MMSPESAVPHPDVAPGARGRSGRRGNSVRRVAVLTFLSIAVLLGDLGRACAYQGFSFSEGRSEDKRSRGTWAALLFGYLALGALATGGAYLLRDDFIGRSVALGAAGWGGLGVGAGAGYGIVHLKGCEPADCSMQEQAGVGIGGATGALAATIAGHFSTRDPGMSRPYTTAVGLAPVFLYLTVGTITDW